MSNERDELMLDSMGATPTGFEIKTHAGGPQTAETLLFIADSMRSMLDEHEAPNYLEMELKGTDGKRYIMTLQRAGKVTPHQARVRAEEALEASKPRTITQWGVSFVHNGAFYKEYSDRETAQAFADDMTGVGAHMTVVTREYVPAVYGEWVAA